MTDKHQDPPADTQAPALPPTPRSSRWPALFALLTLLLMAGLVGVGHHYWQGIQARFDHLRGSVDLAQDNQQDLMRQLQEAISGLAEQQQRLQRQELLLHSQVESIKRQSARLEQDKQRLTRQEQAVSQTLENLHAEVGRTGQQWRAAEAAYLVELARQRLRLEHDPGTALEALQAAAERLRETGDPLWQPVRDRLAVDMDSLRQVQKVDRSALSKTLVRMGTRIQSLPLKSPKFSPAAPVDGHRPARHREPDLDGLLHDGLSGLMTLVRVHRPGQQANLPRGPEESYAVRQNLRLQLDAARFGLLRGDRDLYDSSLDAAQAWIGTFFQADTPETQLYLNDITDLRAARIQPELPDLTPTLDLLRERLEGMPEESS